MCCQGFPEEAATAQAVKIFEGLDVNKDGSLEEEEFVQGCLENEAMMGLLNSIEN